MKSVGLCLMLGPIAGTHLSLSTVREMGWTQSLKVLGKLSVVRYGRQQRPEFLLRFRLWTLELACTLVMSIH
jgi:hypothetical protein